MAGYYGFSMSNNAVVAYDEGQKPLSKWTKKDIIEKVEELIQEEELVLNCSMATLKKMPVKLLKESCLKYSSWHHTSNHFNKTDFYSIDTYKLEKLTDELIEKMISEEKSNSKEIGQPEEEIWECEFLEWSGTRKHPKATVCTEVGIIKGDWFYRADGTKKRTTANGFRFIKKVQ